MLRRLAAGATLAVAPMLIALGAATVSHADTGITATENGSISAPAQQGTMRNQDIIRDYLPHTSLSHHQKRYYSY
jgi:hypothetical protein